MGDRKGGSRGVLESKTLATGFSEYTLIQPSTIHCLLILEIWQHVGEAVSGKHLKQLVTEILLCACIVL
ncbi:hypothetical protein DPMN_006917 [Dreissena polymorpha]|uniref:Uncharacterized protein n=1 Tax=Dreissena polymorpha TaxID=45954 RepID=A0A9D4MVI7_DREPO|nr:hypothetical protein DPMN_006917 [Dreissena polymorpha]